MYILPIRYPRLSELLKENLKLWPAYVHWARGCLKLAADDFAVAIEQLENRMWTEQASLT